MKESITIEWCWSDVLEVDESLTKEQCCQVLGYVDKHLDSNYGITWDTIENAIYELFK